MSDAEHKQTGAAPRQTGKEKTARNPIKIVPLQQRLRKPEWIRVKPGSGAGYNEVKRILREHQLHTVCEEASCPNIGECFANKSCTFMILGDICTRNCSMVPLCIDLEKKTRNFFKSLVFVLI